MKRRVLPAYKALNPLRTFAETVASRASDGTRVLDIGCGFDTRTLATIKGRRVGIDLVSSFRPAAGVHVLRASGEQLPFGDETFDLVCCRSVLEHVEDPGALFGEVRRVLRANGSFVFVTPNRWDYVSLVSTVVPDAWHPWLVHRLTGRAEEKTFPTLYRANTVSALRRLASTASLGVDSLKLSRQHPHYLRRSLVLYSLGVVFEQLVQRPLPALRPWILGIMRRA
jgi:SAM-dependent methyltransferase